MSEPTHREAIERVQTRSHSTHWIDGAASEAAGDGEFTVTDPTTGEPVVDVPAGDAATVGAAVRAADRAADGWAERSAGERADLLVEWAEAIDANRDDLALVEAVEMGKPLAFAREEAASLSEFLRYYAGVARGQHGRHVDRDGSHSYVRREPFGVVALILPWNYPLELFAWKAGAALAAGNVVVVKPSRQAPLALTTAARLAADVLPDGVVNVVNGRGSTLGEPLSGHRSVRKVSVTGSVPVGRTVMQDAAETITPVTLELGGNNPFVVFPDADVAAAADVAAGGRFYNTGQSCGACARVLVHEDVHDEFADAVVEAAAGWEPGDPLVEGTQMGPLAYADHREDVAGYIEAAREAGATLLYGGDRPDGAGLADGEFFEPTVFTDIDPSMRVVREETFGPILTIDTFGSYEAAIERANDTEYGLSAGVATTDISRAHRAAADLEAGSVWVNQWHDAGPALPFGGFKQSGIGRECAEETVEAFQQSKTVSVALDEQP